MIEIPKYKFENEKAAIDYVNKHKATDIKELAKIIEFSAIWDGYEDFHISENVLKIIMENYDK